MVSDRASVDRCSVLIKNSTNKVDRSNHLGRGVGSCTFMSRWHPPGRKHPHAPHTHASTWGTLASVHKSTSCAKMRVCAHPKRTGRARVLRARVRRARNSLKRAKESCRAPPRHRAWASRRRPPPTHTRWNTRCHRRFHEAGRRPRRSRVRRGPTTSPQRCIAAHLPRTPAHSFACHQALGHPVPHSCHLGL